MDLLVNEKETLGPNQDRHTSTIKAYLIPASPSGRVLVALSPDFIRWHDGCLKESFFLHFVVQLCRCWWMKLLYSSGTKRLVLNRVSLPTLAVFELWPSYRGIK